MNTRIQVEHPITEEIFGIDLIKEQLKISSNYPLSFTQEDLKMKGHAIECRINAEKIPEFSASPGKIETYHAPGGLGVRIDSAIYAGYIVPPYYDSLIAKVICKGRNRTEAIQRTLRSLDEFVLEGITTTIDLHKKILNHKKFIDSDFDTNWLSKEKFF